MGINIINNSNKSANRLIMKVLNLGLATTMLSVGCNASLFEDN